MNFFEMLVLSRKMEFKDNGEVTLYGQGIVVLPDALMVEYLLQIDNEPEWKKTLYSTAKEAMLEFKGNFIKAYNSSGGSNWICDTVNLLGQGKIKYENTTKAPLGTILIENSPTAKNLKGNVKMQTDHVLRGILAGIISAVLEKDIDVIESDCVATGGTVCKLIVDYKENLKSNFPAFYEQQV